MKEIRLAYAAANKTSGFKFTASYEGYGYISGEIFGDGTNCWGGCYVLGYGDSTTDIYSYSYTNEIETVEITEKFNIAFATSQNIEIKWTPNTVSPPSISKTWTVGTDLPAGRKIFAAYIVAITSQGLLAQNPTAHVALNQDSVTFLWSAGIDTMLEDSASVAVEIMYFYK